MNPSPVCLHTVASYSHGDQIFLVGRRLEVRRFDSPGLHHIKSVSSIAECCIVKDIRGLWLVGSLRVRRRFFAMSKPSER